MDINLTTVNFISDHNLTPHYHGGGEMVERQGPTDWCVIPPPLANGRYRPSRNRCRPENTTPACKMIPGALVFSDWVIYMDYCYPGYSKGTKNTIAVCVKGQWLPRLPTCNGILDGDSPPPCVQSLTVVNGKTVCRGDVVFEDSFNNLRKWRRIVIIGQIASFLVFSADKKNSFTSNGILVIRPTVYDDVQVTSGSIKLEGCSENKGPEDCARTGSPDNILPPVATALISPANPFTFTYGEVEFRAKLPVGDWIEPEIGLIYQRDHILKGGFTIAARRGNSDLKCNGVDTGIGRIETRITMISQITQIRKSRYIVHHRPNLADNWHYQYHNYSVIWKPGSISFKIDNELIGEVVAPANKTLCEDFGFTREECLTWTNGSMFAPFDKRSTVTLGVSVGDEIDYPDDCINRGHRKPWKNNDEVKKKRLEFWQDRGNWLPTWSEDGSSLYVDHLRITAV